MSTPYEKLIKEQIRETVKTAKMEKNLKKYGHKVSGGYMMTANDLRKYFNSRRRRRK